MKAEEWIDPLFPSAVLVSYLNELPSPLIPPDMYETFIGICGKILKFLANFAETKVTCIISLCCILHQCCHLWVAVVVTFYFLPKKLNLIVHRVHTLKNCRVCKNYEYKTYIFPNAYIVPWIFLFNVGLIFVFMGLNVWISNWCNTCEL